mgnify:CR=1 FL=1
MATTTSLVLIQRLSEAIGDYRLLTADADGSATTSRIVDAEFANLTEDAGGLPGWVKVVSTTDGAAPLGEIRRVANGAAGYTVSGTIMVVNQAFSAALGAGDTFEHHRFDPVVKRTAINAAIRQLWPSIYLPIRDESLVVDNLLSNSGFETAASGNLHPSWTKVGTPTITDETSIRRHLTNSAKIIASGASEGETQTVQVNIDEMIGKTVDAAFWVYATTANWARIRVDVGSADWLNSDYHTGADEWQYLEIHATIPESAVMLGLRLEVADGGTAYFDAGYMAVGKIHKMTVPTSIVRGPHRVEQQVDESDPNGDYLNLDNPIRGHRLRVRGMGHLSQPSTDSGTVEIGDEYVDLIAAKAAEILFQMVSGDAGKRQHSTDYWHEIVHGPRGTRGQGMINEPGNRMVPPPIGRLKGSWHVEDDDNGSYIMLDGR